jgi:hypothetical protein
VYAQPKELTVVYCQQNTADRQNVNIVCMEKCVSVMYGNDIAGKRRCDAIKSSQYLLLTSSTDCLLFQSAAICETHSSVNWRA